MAPDEDINSAAESERLVCVSIKVEEEDKEQKNQENKPLWDTMLDTWYMLGPRVRTHILQLFFFIICLAAILPWYYSSKIQDDSDTFHFYPETSNISGPDSVFLLQINMQAIDPSLLSTSLSFSLQPAGNFSFASVTGEEAVQDVIYFPPSYIQALLEFYNLSLADPNVPVEPSVIFFVTSYGVNEVPSDQLAPQFVQTYPLSAVKALTQYPLDVYEWKLFIRVYLRLVGVADRAEQTAYTILPLTVKVKNLVSGFDTYATATFAKVGSINPYESDKTVQVETQIQRLGVVKGLSVFIVVIMWILSLAVFVVAYDHYFIQPVLAQANPTCATLCSGLLFALPALRLVQPGIPPLTAYLLVDVCGFYLCMGLVAISACLMVSKLNWQYQPPRALAAMGDT